jgi:hypothetical protein
MVELDPSVTFDICNLFVKCTWLTRQVETNARMIYTVVDQLLKAVICVNYYVSKVFSANYCLCFPFSNSIDSDSIMPTIDG